MKRCWIYQRAIAWTADSQAQLPRWVERHLHACPDCRRAFQAEAQVTAALTQGDAPLKDFPPFLHARIMSALERDSSRADQRTPGVPWIRAALLPGLGVLIIAVYGIWKSGSGPAPVFHAAAPSSATPSRAIQPSATVPELDPAQLLTWSENLDQPLETELHAVMSDAKTALNALSATFIPRTLLAKADIRSE